MILNSQAKLISNQAAGVAALMAASESLTAAFVEGVRLAKDNKISVQNIHFELFGNPFGEPDGVFDAEEFAKLPVVGSKEGETGNLLFDQFEYTDSAGKTQRGSFWRYVAEAHPVGNGYKTVIDAINIRKERQNEYTGLSDADAKKLKKDVSADFTAFFGKLRIAVEAYAMMNEIADKFKDVVVVRYAQLPVIDPKTKKQVIVNKEPQFKLDDTSPQIIEIEDATNAKVSTYFTMANFARLNPDKALAGNADYGALITSNGRASDDDENPDEEKHIAIKTDKDFEDGSIAMLQYLNGAKKNAAMWRKLVTYYSKDAPQDRVETLAAVIDALNVLAAIPDVKKQIDAIDMATKKAA